MGAFYGSIQLRSDDHAAVLASAQEVADASGIGLFVAPEIDGWIGIYPQRGGQDETIGRQFAEHHSGFVLQLIIHDDDVFAYWLYEHGSLCDSYWSTPGYFGERHRRSNLKMVGRVEAFRPLIGDQIEQLAPILDRDAPQPVFMSEKLAAFARVLGIANALQSFESLKYGREDPVVRFEVFKMISPRGRSNARNALPRSDAVDNKAISYLQSGCSKMVAKDHSGALLDLNKALELQPGMRLALFTRGSVKHFMGDFSGAIEDQSRVIELSPDKADAYMMRGRARLEFSDIAGALADLDKAVELEPESASATSGRGDAYRAIGDLEKALADYDRSLELNDESSKTWNNRGFTRKKMGDLKGALSDFDEAIARESDPGFFKNRADVKRMLKDLDGSIADYDETIRLSSKHGLGWAGRGLAKSDRGDLAGAISDYNMAIQLRPDDAIIHKNRSLARQKSGDLPGALADIERAIQLGGPIASFIAGRAEIRRLQKDFANSLLDFDQSIEQGYRTASAFNSRGLVKFALGDLKGSLADFDHALAASPIATQIPAIMTNRNALLKKLGS
jgi:tetratricopeptide (TPR) repeat protein